MIAAMILAGGTGSRVGADRPKQFIEISGKPILAYTIEIYQNHPAVDAIQVVCHKDWIDYLKSVIQKNGLTKVKWIVNGGEDFQGSVINGINSLKGKCGNEDILIVHYGASPFTDARIIDDAIRVCKIHSMSVSCTPCYQLLGSNDPDGESKSWIDRDKIVQIACPQCFKFVYITDIYKRAEEKGLLKKTEPHTTSLMYALGDTVYQSYGNQTNIKITTNDDIDLFKRLLNK